MRIEKPKVIGRARDEKKCALNVELVTRADCVLVSQIHTGL
jgi:hypothetical protein